MYCSLYSLLSAGFLLGVLNFILCSFAVRGEHPGEDSIEDPNGDRTPSHLDNHLGSPSAAGMTLPSPGVMQGPRAGMLPLQPLPNMASPHLPHFLPPPNMPHMPSQMMPAAPIYAPERFRVPMGYPPHGPPFHRHLSMEQELMEDEEERHFRNGRPGFGYPPFQRGRW